jgi:hypothetical protein
MVECKALRARVAALVAERDALQENFDALCESDTQIRDATAARHWNLEAAVAERDRAHVALDDLRALFDGVVAERDALRAALFAAREWIVDSWGGESDPEVIDVIDAALTQRGAGTKGTEET